ncbi:hypothetical protein HYV72_02350, partial [Candidatus Uhrbacteria bacterium]|nr:hypothetical protein [Candidatus Uhrbacteria bacterium]
MAVVESALPHVRAGQFSTETMRRIRAARVSDVRRPIGAPASTTYRQTPLVIPSKRREREQEQTQGRTTARVPQVLSRQKGTRQEPAQSGASTQAAKDDAKGQRLRARLDNFFNVAILNVEAVPTWLAAVALAHVRMLASLFPTSRIGVMRYDATSIFEM